MEALLVIAAQTLPDGQKVVRAQAFSWLALLFTEEDWQAMSAIAAQNIAHDIQHLAREATTQTVIH